MRTARDVPTPLLCKNSMISRSPSALPARDDALRALRTDPGHLAQAIGLLLDDVKHGRPEGSHQLFRIDRSDAADHPEPRDFSIPSIVVGGADLRNEALNWTP